MKIYISGRISGLPFDEVIAKFAEAEKRLSEMGHIPLSPLKNGMPDVANYATHMIIDIMLLLEADAIYMLNDWVDSQGAITELTVARATGKQIFYENDQKHDVIMLAICEITGVKRADIIGTIRKLKYVHARMLVAQLMSESGVTIEDIKITLNKQYSTILHYLEVYKTEVKTNKRFKELDKAVRKRISQDNNIKIY